jgi:branched-chain amino acid aminotransferase
MIITTYQVTSRGEIQPLDVPAGTASLNAASALLPGGVYTTFRTYQSSKVLSLEDHMNRLEESAGLLGKPLTLQREQVRAALREAVRLHPRGDSRVRLTVDLEQQTGDLYLSMQRLVSPSLEDYSRGVSAVTSHQQRDNPEAKHTSFISVAESIRKDIPEGVHEGLIVTEDGTILEGLSSNFFAVKGGVLHTAGEAVLSGIARSMVLEAAGRRSLKVSTVGINVADLPKLEEAFITSSTRGVLPVRRIDGRTIADGMVGQLTLILGEDYRRLLLRRLEEI